MNIYVPHQEVSAIYFVDVVEAFASSRQSFKCLEISLMVVLGCYERCSLGYRTPVFEGSQPLVSQMKRQKSREAKGTT